MLKRILLLVVTTSMFPSFISACDACGCGIGGGGFGLLSVYRNNFVGLNYGILPFKSRFASLKEVLEHYRSGILLSETLDPGLRNGIPTSDEEMADLTAFLETLTDWELVQDPRF